jgi:hypothetical protein
MIGVLLGLLAGGFHYTARPRLRSQEGSNMQASDPTRIIAPGECTSTCVCCGARVIAHLARLAPFINHGRDRLSGEPCPRTGWPVLDAIRTDDDIAAS